MKSLLSFAAQTAAAIVRPAVFGLATILGLGAQFTATAQTAPAVQVTQTDGESLRVRINNATNKPAKMRVTHLENSNILLSEKHHETAYGTLLKFGNLPVGHYNLWFRVGDDKFRYTVRVQQQAPGRNVISVKGLAAPAAESVVASAAN